MALIKKTTDKTAVNTPAKGATLTGKAGTAAATAKMEQEPQGDTAVIEEPATPAATSTSTAVAAAAPRAVAVAPALTMMDVIGSLKNAFTVDWDTMDRVQANNGNFLDKGKNNAALGDTIQMHLMSWQDTWQVTPGEDGEEALAHVRYSDDGKTTKQGEDIAEYLDKLRQIYPKAKCDHRCTLVGVLQGSAKDSRLEGEIFQIDLSQTSRKEFDKYRLSTAYKIGKNILSPDAAVLLTMIAEVMTVKSVSWTLVRFSPTLLEA